MGARAGALTAKALERRGTQPSLLRRDAQYKLVSVKTLAMGGPTSDYLLITWRPNSNWELCPRFTAVRVRAAHRDQWRTELRDEKWLLIDWPDGQNEAEKYVLSKLPADTSLERLVAVN